MRDHPIATVKDVAVYLTSHDHRAPELNIHDKYNRHTLQLTADEADAMADGLREGARLMRAAKERK